MVASYLVAIVTVMVAVFTVSMCLTLEFSQAYITVKYMHMKAG